MNTMNNKWARRIGATVRFLLVVAVLLSGSGAPARAVEPDSLIQNALVFIRSQQNADGSFGSAVQPHLQTGLAMLALLSSQAALSEEEAGRIERAAVYLEKAAATGGDLGDRAYATESHAVATLALLSAIEHLRSSELKSSVTRRVTRAVQWLERIQDRGTAAQIQGGWKMEGGEGRVNDRRATAWALLALYAARQAGWPVKEAGFNRGGEYLLGSFKKPDTDARQAGGLSVDAEGMAVESISAMGGWFLARCLPRSERLEHNQQWLIRNPPGWTGPNYFSANFFRMRALKFGDRSGQEYERARQRLRTQFADHRRADGAVDFPPGNAQNTVDMGPAFSTSLAVLILNVDESRLVFDEDYRVAPLF